VKILGLTEEETHVDEGQMNEQGVVLSSVLIPRVLPFLQVMLYQVRWDFI
jgi:hypothetical protein